MPEIDAAVARDRDALPADAGEFLPSDLLEKLGPETSAKVMEFALGWGEMAKESQKRESVHPSDNRYWDDEVSSYLGEQTSIRTQACVQGALAYTLADFGICPEEVADEIWEACLAVRAEEVYLEEYGLLNPDGTIKNDDKGDPIKEGTKHDGKALTKCITSRVSNEAKPYVNMFATTFDIKAPAEAIRYREAVHGLIVPRLMALEDTLIDLTEHYADTVQMGRSHGQHGEPITFGFAMAQHVSRIGDCLVRIHRLAGELPGKFSGAMGAYNTLSTSAKIEDPIEFENRFLEKLGLTRAEISTQIAPAGPMARLLDELGVVSGYMASLADDMRHLQRSEINETREKFDKKNQSGSQGMPHKRNPISFENVAGLERVVQAEIAIGHANLKSEHQRDLRDSSSSRFYASTMAVVAEMTKRLRQTMAKIEVDPDAMMANLLLGGGKIGSGFLQTELRDLGHPAAHDEGRRIMAKAEEMSAAEGREVTFTEVLLKDEELAPYLERMSDETRELILHPETSYTGKAGEVAREVATNWRQKLAELRAA